MIHKLNFIPSPELEKELKFFSETNENEKIYSVINSKEDLIRWVESNADFMDLKTIVRRFRPGPLLDVGVGWGVTSAYFAAKGFRVSCVEPSRRSCENMQKFFNRLGLEISIYEGIAESFNQIQENFSCVVFWASLHHCDDPVLALENTREKLKPGGSVILFEPVLRFYRSKKWFFHMMKVNPEKMGHYGGNEHIYRYHEYVDFLRSAGFAEISSSPSIKYKSDPKRAPWDSNGRWFIKRLYYRLAGIIIGESSFLSRLLTKFSVLTPVLVGRKKKWPAFLKWSMILLFL